jgi:hypothetical protein
MIQKNFGNEEIGCMQVNECFRWFKEGWTLVESNERSGRPFTSRNQLMTDKMHSAVLGNRRITIRELSDELGLSFGSVQSILTEDVRLKHI